MEKPRLLKAGEISCRVQQVTQGNGAILLLYKDARVDMDILDETFGPENWQRKHIEIGGNLHCIIEVWDDAKKQWIAKQDVGVESNTEATKGEASDSFKRAGTNWGIGRELYTSPFIFIQLEPGEIRTSANGKVQVSSKFGVSVSEIDYSDDRRITRLVLTDRKGNARFTYGGKKKQQSKPEPIPEPEEKPITRGQMFDALAARYHKDNKYLVDILKHLQDTDKIPKKSSAKMTNKEYEDTLKAIEDVLRSEAGQTINGILTK